MPNIKSIKAHEIIDSRGIPTLEGRLELDDGREVVASIPSGTSVGKYEAVELRDGDKNRFGGMGVSRAASYINDLIGPKLSGVSPLKQEQIDSWLIKSDGTSDKSKLGANTLLLVSTLVAKAGAVSSGVKLYRYINTLLNQTFKQNVKVDRIPTPIFNIINGGKHANNNLEFQEFHIIPSSSLTFTEAYQTGVEIFHELKKVLLHRNANISVGEEGGFAPNLSSNLDALEAIRETIQQRGLRPGVDIFLGLDIAANNFFKDDRYVLKDKPQPLKKDEYYVFIEELVRQYTILMIEDPFEQDDVANWKKLTGAFSESVDIIGDDLIATNKDRLVKMIKEKACTTVLIKPNQIGTITQTLEVVDIARRSGFNYVVSHRSGDTSDSFIADFAVGVNADFAKFGAPSRGERVVKYNRLWQIAQEGIQ